MSKWTIAATYQVEREKDNVDIAAFGVANKERMNLPVIAEQMAREKSEQYREVSLNGCATIVIVP